MLCGIFCIGLLIRLSKTDTEAIIRGKKKLNMENNLMWKVSYIISNAFLCLHSNSCSLRKLVGML